MEDAPYFEMTLRYRGEQLYQVIVDGQEREPSDCHFL